ncbi:Sporulation kinase A [compost metagenome]
MKVKLLTVLVIIAVIFVSAVLWKVDGFIYGDRLSWVEAQTRTQTSAINHSIGMEMKSLRRLVSTFNAENFRKERINWAALGPYYALASFSVNGVRLEPQTVLTRDRSVAASWNADFVRKAVGTLGEKSSSLRIFVKPFQDSNKGRHVALVVVEGNRAYGLFGGGELFQSLIDAQKGSLSSFSVITSTGLTVGHSIPEYLGTVMSDDVVFKEARKRESSQGAGVFKTAKGHEIYGMYEQVPNTNLYVLSSASLKDAMKGRKGLIWQFVLMGAGLILVGIAGILWVVLPQEKQVENLEQSLLKAQAQAQKTPIVEKSVVLDVEGMQKEKMQAYMRVASALGHEMRGPLMAILGHSQMILAKTDDTDIVQNTESILRETRSTRGILDKLFSFAGEEVTEKNSMKLEGPLARALKNVDPLVQTKGVKLVRNIQDTAVMDLNMDALTKAFENILTNSVEAMDRMPKKEIHLDLFEDADGVHLKIKDTGEGIEAALLEKIFDPFFTTRSFKNHMGLGLAVALGVFKEHRGEVQVTSERGQGTEVHVIFKREQSLVAMEAPKAPGPLPVIEEEQEITISRELPQLSEAAPEHEEAQVEFEASQEKTVVGSPLDMNIDNLLELPEVQESKPVVEETSVAAPVEAAEAVTPNAAPAPIVRKKETTSDELVFLEDLEKADVVTSASAAFNDEATVVNVIAPPKMEAKVKVSKLDSYHVEIRRPGKRL